MGMGIAVTALCVTCSFAGDLAALRDKVLSDDGGENETGSYTVTFIADNGDANESQKVSKGGKAVQPKDPVKTGYNFVHWFNEADDAEWDFDEKVTADIRLKAKWDIISYTVIFDADNGASPTSQTVNHGAKAVKPADPEKTGYNFVNWFNIENDIKWEEEPVTADISLKAKWEIIITHTVIFDADNGASPTSQTVVHGAKAVIPADPEKTGYNFVNWFNAANDIKWEDEPITADITLKAKWVIAYTVSFDADNGSAATSQNVSHGEKAVQPAAPEKTGYNFVHWFNTADDTIWNFDTIITAEISLKARWDIKTYTVSFDSRGGSAVSSINGVEHGSTVASAPTAPVSDYGTFDGWYSDLARTSPFIFGSSAVTNNTTLYAKWNAQYELQDEGPGTGRIFHRDELGFTVEAYVVNPGAFSSYTAYYLEAAPADSGAAVWGPDGYIAGVTIVGYMDNSSPNLTIIGNGRRDTRLIILYSGEADTAAKLAAEASFGGKNDWFLPSAGELRLLYQQRTLQGIGITSGHYWSSTQCNVLGMTNFAWRCNFSGGSFSYWERGSNNVRAIRAF